MIAQRGKGGGGLLGLFMIRHGKVTVWGCWWLAGYGFKYVLWLRRVMMMVVWLGFWVKSALKALKAVNKRVLGWSISRDIVQRHCSMQI